MKFLKVKTRTFLPPQDDLWRLLDDHLPKLKDGDVLLITSKILAIHQGRCLKIEASLNKDKLIKKEADHYLDTTHKTSHGFLLTIKDHTLIFSSGIDESNGNGYYVLWPKNTQALLKEIHRYLTKKFNLKKLGLIATDSYTTPLRWGLLGVSIGFYGFEPLRDYRGKEDVFGRKLQFTRTNIVDALSAMGVMLMGEGNEKTPLLIVRGASFVKFTTKDRYRKLIIPPKEDIYYPLFRMMTKKKRGR